MTVRSSDDTLSRRLHVLHVCATTRGRAESVALASVRDQLDRGWRVSVACHSRGHLGYAARELGARTSWWQALDGDGGPRGRGLGAALRLRQVLADADPDVVHLHGPEAGHVGRLVVRNRRPTVLQPHVWLSAEAITARGGASTRWERMAASRWTAALVCSTPTEALAARHLGLEGRVAVIPLGVDLSVYRPQGRRDRARSREQVGLGDSPTVVCVGELTRDHGQRTLLEAWVEVGRRVPGSRLVLVGDGPDRSHLARAADDLAGVSLVGGRADVRAWLSAADVVAVPAQRDGTSLVALEAMACARSVVATGVAGILDTIPEDAGALVPPGDPVALADALAHRLTHPARAEDEGWTGREHVEQHHDAAESAQELARVYLRLVGERRSG